MFEERVRLFFSNTRSPTRNTFLSGGSAPHRVEKTTVQKHTLAPPNRKSKNEMLCVAIIFCRDPKHLRRYRHHCVTYVIPFACSRTNGVWFGVPYNHLFQLGGIAIRNWAPNCPSDLDSQQQHVALV